MCLLEKLYMRWKCCARQETRRLMTEDTAQQLKPYMMKHTLPTRLTVFAQAIGTWAHTRKATTGSHGNRSLSNYSHTISTLNTATESVEYSIMEDWEFKSHQVNATIYKNWYVLLLSLVLSINMIAQRIGLQIVKNNFTVGYWVMVSATRMAALKTHHECTLSQVTARPEMTLDVARMQSKNKRTIQYLPNISEIFRQISFLGCGLPFARHFLSQLGGMKIGNIAPRAS